MSELVVAPFIRAFRVGVVRFNIFASLLENCLTFGFFFTVIFKLLASLTEQTKKKLSTQED